MKDNMKLIMQVNNNKSWLGMWLVGKIIRKIIIQVKINKVSAGKVVCGGDTIAGNVVLDLATPGHGAVAQMA